MNRATPSSDVELLWIRIGIFPKIRGFKPPKMDLVKIMGCKASFLMDDLGGKPTIFGNTRIARYNKIHRLS